LIGALLSSIAAGASVYCTPGFNAMRFFGWLDEVEPSWYSATPAMHQAILSCASRNEQIRSRHTLRLIRSSSAALPPQALKELEETFGAPVVDSYGMTGAWA
jgi:acyl-CoA synthetase (AMP-forming)/AMP-acid ligase II